MSGIEHRMMQGAVRAPRAAGTKPGVTLKIITANVVDDYKSVFLGSTFDESLQRRLPTLCWAHLWEEPLGPATGFRRAVDGPEVDFVFSDFEAVPQARRAYAQVKDGTIRDCSVGFSNAIKRPPTEAEVKMWPGVREVIVKADLDECSLVLRGAVPGAAVTGVRALAPAAERNVARRSIAELQRDLAHGRIIPGQYRAAVAGRTAGSERTSARRPPPKPVDLRSELVRGQISLAQYEVTKALYDEVDEALDQLRRRGIRP